MPLVVEYPAFASGEPRRMTAEVIASSAATLRSQLFGTRTKAIEVSELAARATRFIINGRPMRVAWDIEHDVRDVDGKPVLGVCEHDPDASNTVMISISGARLIDRPETFRSTAVHELAHAIFDMPAALNSKTRKTIRTLFAEAPANAGKEINWQEWRAGIYMGAFIVPLNRLAHAVARQAGAMDIPFRWRSGPNGLPIPAIEADPNAQAIDWFVDALAETFGVSSAFMAVRLKKGGLIGSRVQAQQGSA